ncbi:LOW QUALITY PROTEIN: butyrophilin subfamily 2 member A1-like [Balearica regulorum gibbericeps]|uniref:LOW QUALITY PROTEIN: butyrophilin subfamily 2 member A1-like n=1 Tax=Balearica regulorum gibbericeps TaxID=100784 RepID=UPI003F639FFE
MGLSVQLTAVIFVLILVSTQHPAAGGGHDPLLVLDGYEDDGIRVKCFSERLFSEVQVWWTDGKGDNVTGTPLTTGTTTANASSSIIVKPGSGNSVSCKIIDKLLKTSTESSAVIADVFFPATSPWLAAFVVILLLSVFLVIAAVYKLRKNNKTTTREKNAEKEIQKEIDELQVELDEETARFKNENQDLLSKIEKVQNELEFRRAHSNAVNITLDENCKHPSLIIKGKNRVKSSTQEEILPKALVVATEAFSGKKHYWEVEVGDKSEWELGVVHEEIRNTLRSNTMNSFQKGNLLSLQFSQGKYILTGEESLQNCKPCSVVGVFLDQEFDRLSFFDVEEKHLLKSLSLEFSGNLYPFFSPGSDGKWLGVRPVCVENHYTHRDILPQGQEEINKLIT